MTTETAWLLILKQLRDKVPGPTYETWFKDTALVGITNGTAQVVVPNGQTAYYLQRRHYQGIARTLSDVIGQELEVLFIPVSE